MLLFFVSSASLVFMQDLNSLICVYIENNKNDASMKINVEVFPLPQELLPDMYLHFQSQGFHTSMYASSWFLTLFATSFSLSLSCRVMDLFISEVSQDQDLLFKGK